MYLAFGLLASFTIAVGTGHSDSMANTDDKKEYLIFPKNGKNEAALKKTEDNIKKITQVNSVYSYRDVQNALLHWLVPVTDSQQKSIREDEGVDGVEENVIAFAPEAAFPRPSPVAQLSDMKPNEFVRNLQYTSQTNAASELVMVSQPT